MAFQVSFYHCSEETIELVQETIQSWQEKKSNFEVSTSGSTGSPKKIQLTRNQIEASAKRTNAFFDLKEKSFVLCCISPKFIGGKMVILRALIGDYAVDFCEPNKLDLFETQQQYDLASFVPLQLNKLLEMKSTLPSKINQILLGGAGISEKQSSFFKKAHSSIYIGFGMTETVSHIALKKLDEKEYRCLSGAEVREQNGQLILSDHRLGIQNLRTNDLVVCSSNTTFSWLGRKDFTINSGGIKIQPEAIENELTDFIQGKFFIAGMPDENLGQKCVLILDNQAEINGSFEEIQQIVEGTFGPYSKPKEMIRTQIALSETGKILRLATLKNRINESK